ncbi:MAG: AAA domain-containing protein [Promethearchaeota archaeon]
MAKKFGILEIEKSADEIEKDFLKDEEEIKKFGKPVFTTYIDTKCLRQLFLKLGKNNPRWIAPNREIKKRSSITWDTKFIQNQGRIYEQKAYSALCKLPNILAQKSSTTKVVVTTFLTPKYLLDIFSLLKSNSWSEVILLEHQFQTPESLLKQIFQPKKDDPSIPVVYSNQRPDIITIRKIFHGASKKYLQILPTGHLRISPVAKSETRFAINIIDVKNIAEEKIGKKQFIEVLYYMWSFAYFLKENKLDDKFMVVIDGNGIFPNRTPEELTAIHTYSDILYKCVTIEAQHTFRLFQDTLNEISSLWNHAPCPIESTEVNIQDDCGYCPYLEDCKETLGMGDKEHPENWSLKLIPYTSPSIAQQLESLGMKTIGDVVKYLPAIKIGNTPEPLYPELPLLKIRSLALQRNDLEYPPSGQIHTYSIPRYTPIALTLALETDPSSERVFAFALYLDMSVPNSAKNFLKFKQWWTIWKESFALNHTPPQITTRLKSLGFSMISEDVVTMFFNKITKLANFKIFLEGEPKKDGTPRLSTRVRYHSVAINSRLDNPNTEVALAIHITNELYTIFEICNVIEKHVVVQEKRIFKRPGKKAKEYIKEFSTEMGVFYWSKEQLENLQSMFERNLSLLTKNITIWDKYTQIISWFTPSDSEVTHAYRHKKLYDLKIFTETILGFPGIMNYTWHEIGATILNTKFNRRYWLDHFNYMDYRSWHKYLENEKEPVAQAKLETELKKQMLRKVQTINLLRGEFQNKSRQSISWHAKPNTLESFRNKVLPRSFHNIGRAWYFFSKLTGSMAELEAENFRTIYPEFSIGKLAAAKVTNLQVLPRDTLHYNLFEICGLSSNMKLKMGDHLLLIPEELRDMRVGSWSRQWVVIIEDFIWKADIGGYVVTTEPNREDFVHNYRMEVEDYSENPIWYLYPKAGDPWSGKLFGNSKGGLLERERFGESWLGKRLAHLWALGLQNEFVWPKSWQFMTPEMYLYFPSALVLPTPLAASSELLTPIHPSPDPSQKAAILEALNHVIYAVQGPPGTGKSQTIAALIDEFYQRAKAMTPPKPVRILVSSFSYAAIRVIIKKIRESRTHSGQPTNSSRLQLIFLRSESQLPIESSGALQHVEDLVRKIGGSWRWNDKSRVITKKQPLEDELDTDFIIFGNAHQLYHLKERVLSDFTFNLIVVDEGSQMPVDQILSALQYVKKYPVELQPDNSPKIAITPYLPVESLDHVHKLKVISPLPKEDLTKLVIVGDHNQLPPVQPILPPKNLEPVLSSLFTYYVTHLNLESTQLDTNYRSHSDIVTFTKSLGFYSPLKASSATKDRILIGDLKKVQMSWVREVLTPEKVVTALIHTRELEIGVSSFEAQIVADLVLGFYQMQQPQTKEQEIYFWKEQVGVVAPHNAQGRLIIQRISECLFKDMKKMKLEEAELRKYLRETVYSVEKFQGSDRQLIITSIGLSDWDQLNAEDEFIYDLNRFNVLTSRAKNKIIYVCSESFLKFIPNEVSIMKSSFQSYKYSFEYCNQEKAMIVSDSDGNQNLLYFRWKSHTTAAIMEPFSSLIYESSLVGDRFSITLTADNNIKQLFQAIPENLVETFMSPVSKMNGWTFKLDDVDKIHTYVPIPTKIMKEKRRHDSLLVETQKENVSVKEGLSTEKMREIEEESNYKEEDALF